MKNKVERLNLIKKIIGSEQISSQEDLIKRLADHGVRATQSTLSRDFKEINISKISHPDKGYIYILSESATHAGVTAQMQQLFPTLKYTE